MPSRHEKSSRAPSTVSLPMPALKYTAAPLNGGERSLPLVPITTPELVAASTPQTRSRTSKVKPAWPNDVMPSSSKAHGPVRPSEPFSAWNRTAIPPSWLPGVGIVRRTVCYCAW